MSKGYPKVMNEYETLAAAVAGKSITRYGDGELRLAAGCGTAVTQPANGMLRGELIAILREPTHALACIPVQGIGPKADRWIDYTKRKFVDMFGDKPFGSAFISRPDSAAQPFTEDYWSTARSLWRNRDVTLVVGTDFGSLDGRFMKDARNLRIIFGPTKDAYSEISRLEDEVGTPPATDPVIMCLGATATVLAERLAKKGVWALDLGHIGKFWPKHHRFPA